MSGPGDNQARQPERGAERTIEPAPFEPPKEPAFGSRWKPSVRAVLAGAVLLACAWAAWFVVTAKFVRITTDPPEAAVSIGGGFSFGLTGRHLMREGRYRIAITAEGYRPAEEILEVGPEANQQVSYTLRKLPGRLRVETRPVDGARIFLGDDERGRTPTVVRDIQPGKYRVRVVADRYRPREQVVTIEGGGVEQRLDVKLEPAWAEVTISSRPPGAEVYVDDEEVGRTPLTTEVLEGRRSVRLRLSGYKEWRDRVAVEAGRPMTLEKIALEPADAVVELASRPAHASVTVDGEYRGRTPLELALEPDEPATVELLEEGYEKARRTLKLASGERRSLTMELEPTLTSIEIHADPPDADLYVDGAPKGKANQTLRITARPHRIRIRKPGYAEHEETVTPRPGIEQQVHVRLKTEREALLESVKPVIETAEGQTLKLFRPQETFTMGASRREPGRRANEVLRRVRLERPFYLSLHEVTNAEFQAFRPSHSSGIVGSHSLNTPKQPVVKVDWEDAALYCNWLSEKDSLPPFYRIQDGKVVGFDAKSTGYRLPTEAEWAWAARSVGNGTLLRFPWGDEMPPAPRSGNYADRSARAGVGRVLGGYDDGFPLSAPVGSFPPNHQGLFDMGGNVAEWVNDYYDIPVVDPSEAHTDPLGPTKGQHHVIRGSSWAHAGLTELRLSFRDYGLEGRDDLGFRIARYLEGGT